MLTTVNKTASASAYMSPPEKLRQDERALIERVLAVVPMFRGAPPGQIAAIAAQCHTLNVKRYGVITRGDTLMPGMYAVASGTVQMSLPKPRNERRVMRLIRAGIAFGAVPVLTGRPSPYEARALTKCKLVVIPAGALFAAMDRDPRIAREVLTMVANWCLNLVLDLRTAALPYAAQRLALYLGSLAPAGGAGSSTVRLPTTKTIIASQLDMKKETLSRLLKKLADGGIIAVKRDEITICDRARLSALSSGRARGS
ncbi:MAG TPA: Crp/Fnr family transcriptional regulator [Croceibacterium sp.]|nr:Crp/Fnr family transcriptional regulator [Croceibacterium sp.]